MSKITVLFMCTGNSARSQMAEAILRKKAGQYFTVYSAGTDPKGINPLTIKVLEEKGYDLIGQSSKHFNQYIGKIQMEIQIAVCSQAEESCPRFPGVGTKLYWPFDDPATVEGSEEEKIRKFIEVRNQIEAKIDAWLHEKKFELPTYNKR